MGHSRAECGDWLQPWAHGGATHAHPSPGDPRVPEGEPRGGSSHGTRLHCSSMGVCCPVVYSSGLLTQHRCGCCQTDWARWQFLDMVVRCRQDEVFATKPRPQATGPRGWNNTFNVSDDVRMFMTRIQMQQYLPVRWTARYCYESAAADSVVGVVFLFVHVLRCLQVFAEWGFDEMASLARVEKKHLADSESQYSCRSLRENCVATAGTGGVWLRLELALL